MDSTDSPTLEHRYMQRMASQKHVNNKPSCEMNSGLHANQTTVLQSMLRAAWCLLKCMFSAPQIRTSAGMLTPVWTIMELDEDHLLRFTDTLHFKLY